MIKKYEDLYSSIFFMGYAILVLILSLSIKKLDVSVVGSAFVPRLVAIGIFILSAKLLWDGIKKSKQATQVSTDEETKDGESQESVNYASVLMTAALMVIYVALIGPLGFLLSTILYLILQIMLFTDRAHWKIPLYVVIAILTSGSIYYIFRMVLHVMLPEGIVG